MRMDSEIEEEEFEPSPLNIARKSTYIKEDQEDANVFDDSNYKSIQPEKKLD